jgi:nitroimidazol reductase NimA-like FMN-containing flavoprotein (pyridoxamine 5'-phosphate oxidase superfamily)
MSDMTFRPMRRFRQQLPDEESLSILETGYRGFLSVIGDGGYPYTVPINYVYDAGTLYFHCAREGHKLDAVRACDKACFTVIDTPEKEPGDWWYHVRSVICFGRICEVSDEVRHDALLRKLGLKYFPEGYDMEDDMRRNAPRAVVLEFRIEHMTGKRVKEK